MSYGVAILSSVAAKNIDALNKSAKFTAGALENGSVISLGAKSSVAGEGDVYVAATPATATLGTDIFYMVYEAPIPVLNGKFKGLTDDPREFNIEAGKVFNCQKPMIGDEIILTADAVAGTKGSNGFVAPVNNTGKLTWAANTTGASLAYALDGTTFISIGNERVTAYKFKCVKSL
jgi:hypothetical protein